MNRCVPCPARSYSNCGHGRTSSKTSFGTMSSKLRSPPGNGHYAAPAFREAFSSLDQATRKAAKGAT